jgi:hypothetical protein
MRFFTLCGVGVIVIVLTVAACGGDSGPESFSQRDLVRILDSAPTKPAGSSWTKISRLEPRSPEGLRRALKAQGLPPADTIDPLMDAGFQGGLEQHWGWSGAVTDGVTSLFPDAAAAGKGFAALQHLVPSWFLPLPLKDLGDEAVSSKSRGKENHRAQDACLHPKWW